MIEFFEKKSGRILPSNDIYFLMNNKVYCDNGYTTESQEQTVMFDDFISDCSDTIGWRYIYAN